MSKRSAVQHSAAFYTYLENTQVIVRLQTMELSTLRLATANLKRAGAQLRKFKIELPPDPSGRAAIIGPLRKLILGYMAAEREEEMAATTRLWLTVMVVTCVEAYVLDILQTAAVADPELMAPSQQTALYAEVVSAGSLDVLVNRMQARWARSWLNDGSPSNWIRKLGKMGARGYDANLGTALDRFWGVRHVVVHRAGLLDHENASRHGLTSPVGTRLRTTSSEVQELEQKALSFVRTTDQFFVRRYPAIATPEPEVPEARSDIERFYARHIPGYQ